MGTYTITTTDDEDNGIAYAAGDPEVDKQAYLEACVRGQMLTPWTTRYQASTAIAPAADVALAYVAAPQDIQNQVTSLLGVQVTPPEEGQSLAQPPGATGMEGVPTT